MKKKESKKQNKTKPLCQVFQSQREVMGDEEPPSNHLLWEEPEGTVLRKDAPRRRTRELEPRGTESQGSHRSAWGALPNRAAQGYDAHFISIPLHSQTRHNGTEFCTCSLCQENSQLDNETQIQ